MSVNAIIEFDDLLQHSFDASKIEITGGQAKLKSQVDVNEVLFANFDADDILLSKRGNKSLVFSGLNNNASVANGLLTFLADRSLATYLNIQDIVDDFAFRCRIQAIVTTVAQDRDLFSLKSNIDTSEVRFFFSNHGGGITRMNAQMVDSVGGITNSVAIIIKDMAIDPNWNIAISNDDDGNILFFVDGVLLATIVSPAFDFTDMDIIFGNDSPSLAAANFDNVQLFKSNAITEAFAFPFPEPTTYLLDPQEIVTAVPFIMDTWTLFSDNKTVLNGSEIKHHPLRDSIRYFFSTVSSLWQIVNLGLDNFSQSNLDTIINTNLPEFPLTVGIGTTIQIASFLKASADGYTTPILDTITLKYGRQHKAGDIGICTVIGVVKDKSGLPVVGAEVEFSSKIKKTFLLNNVLIGPTVTATTDSEGKWSLSLVETASTQNTVTAKIDFKNGTDEVREFKNLTIPDLPSKEFEDIVLGI